MARKIIDIGIEGNDGTGDSIRESFRKTNENFTELYAVFGLGGQIAFTDLSDTPDTLSGNQGRIPVVNASGNAMVFKAFQAGDGISITQPTSGPDANKVVFTALSSQVSDDPTPELSFSLNANGQPIGNVYSPSDDTAFNIAVNQFNTVYGPPNVSIDTFAVNKGYVDNKFINVSGDNMAGPLTVPAGASGNQVPRTSEVITRGGSDANRTMISPLFLHDHPGELAGRGTPNGADDLQAATKYYVDNANYSSNINLYVSTTGSDSQTNTPPGKDGRSWAYAFASINKACQKAEELMDAATPETGPYRQLIAYGNGAAFSVVTDIGPGAVSGTVRIKFSNNGGSRVDQGLLPKPDILAGKLVVGRTSGARGIIYQYYGADGATNSDFFDLQDVSGDFVLGENLEYDQPVKTLNLTIYVESGTYFEDFPIRLPQNVSLVGDELRRVIIRPADRPSRSPWADIWFRRDETFDGMNITSTLYGYHYLTDPSDRASEPKNNRDIDVFLCNDATILRQISCQGHGGFMMVLDPEGQVLSKSPYFQQGSSFCRSLNKQTFAGGQYVDGFAGNLPLNVNSKPSEFELLVSGSERAPQTPCSFVVSGRTFKVDTYTDDGTGFNGARRLIRANKEFIKAEVIGYINTELNPNFSFNRTKCARDVGFIIDALANDLVFGTNYLSVVAGKSYYGKNDYDNLLISNENSLAFQKSATLEALEYLRTQVFDLLFTNTTARTLANNNMLEIIDIVDNGLTAANAYSLPNPAGTTTNVGNAKNILLDNFEFLKAEYVAYIQNEYPTFVFDEPQYAKDLEETLYAVVYDLIYSGNSASIGNISRYFDPDDDSSLVAGQSGQIAAGYGHVISLMQSIITSTTIVPLDLAQTTVPQVLNAPSPGTVSEANIINNRLGIFQTVILSGISSLPTEVPVSLTTVNTTLLESRTLLLTAKPNLQSNVLTFLDLRFNYDEEICARDTGYIVEAIAHDVYYGGNLKTVQAGLAYFNGTASAQNVINTQLAVTIDAIEYIETLILDVIENQSPTNRYQTIVPQIVDGDITDGALATIKINDLFDELIQVLDNPPNATEARSLLVQNKEFIKAEVISFIGITYSTTATATTSGTNAITCTSTDNLRANMPIEFGISSSLGALQGTKGITGSSIIAAATYTNVPVYTQSGSGSGAVVTVVKTGSGTTYNSTNTIVSITSNGTGYKINDQLKILGTDLGGTTPANDLFFRAAPSTTLLIGGIQSSRKYYVKNILSPTQFTISNLPGGTAVTLTTDGPSSVPVQLSYNFTKCARDVGFIVANTSADLLYGGTYNTVRAARTYFEARASVVIGEQLTETLASLEKAKEIALAVLNQDTYETSPGSGTTWQDLNSVASPVGQVFDAGLDGTTSVTTFGNLMDLVNDIISNPNFDITTNIPTARDIVYPVYRLVVSDPSSATGAGITNPLSINVSSFGSSVADPSGSYFVTLNHAPVTDPLYAKTRYTISGNSNPEYNRNVECVSSTNTSMTFKFTEGNPGAWGTGTTTITYIDDIELLSPGNTSMCSNDFTQINDLGYGLVATNIGLVEAVSVFSYYCWTAYYANNGGQIRSLNGSNANGEYGLVSAGSDPLEVPDQARLADNMVQVGQVYKTGIYSLENNAEDVEIIAYNLDYAPYNVSEIEVNHGSGIIVELETGSLVGGSGYTNGTYLNVPLVATTGSGISATANIVVSGGQVVTVALTNGGFRYQVGDFITDNGTTLGGGAGFSISVKSILGNGIGRYEVASVTDVSSTVPSTVSSVSAVSGTGPYTVTFTIPDPGFKPRTGVNYVVAGNANTNYNRTVTCISSTRTVGINATITVSYTSNPGVYGAGTTTIWGQGNIIRLNLSTGGNNDTATTGLAVGLSHNQTITVRGNQNFKFYEIDDTNPVRPSTALTFVDDPNGADENAEVYRVLAYSSKDPLNNNVALDESVLSFDTTYDYVKLVINIDKVSEVDPANPGKTLGSTTGDVAIAVERVTESIVADRLNSADMIFAWDGKIHEVVSYEDQGVAAGYGILRFTDVTAKSLTGTVAVGINSPLDPATNLDLTDAPTIRAGLARDEFAEIVVRISTCRVTGHDFLDIGTGGYNNTNYPSKIYGAPRSPQQSREVEERTRGRVFYVTTDQNGIFRVGRFFTVDQGTGRVTFSASIALSNLDGIGFKRGVAISEFSNDEKFTDGATDTVPTENAIQGYVDLRLGLFRSNSESVDLGDRIGPGFLDCAGINSATANLNIGGFILQNVGSPGSDSDAANKGYVDDTVALFDELAELQDVTFTGLANNNLIAYNGTDWVNASQTGDVTFTLSGNVLTSAITANSIVNADVNSAAAIAQSKLAMNAATTRANATGITQTDRGLASFNNTQFTVTDGWVELQTSTSALTGVTLNKIQRISNNTILGNRSGSAASPTEITPGQVVTDGDGIKNASFTTVGAMTVTANTPNTYSVTAITTNGGANSLVRTNSLGEIDVKGLFIDGFNTLDVSANTLISKTPGGVNFLTAVGNSAAATTVTLTSGTFNVTGNTAITGTLSSTSNISTSGSGNITSAGSVTATTGVSGTTGTFTTSVTTPLLIGGGAGETGLVRGNWSLDTGSRFIATYADLAEYYEADQEYEVGTVLIFGGEKEITTTQVHMDHRVAGVVSETAAYLMNEGCPGIKTAIALQGRVPVKVIGVVKKGDLLVSAGKPGYAIASSSPKPGTIIGKALANKDTADEGIVEVAVGRC